MNIYQFSAPLMNGDKKSIGDYQGKVLLIVNTATKCGFAPQFQELQELYNKYKEQSFEVLGFPTNQFMNQEPGSDKEIAKRCQLNFGVNFSLFKKIDVRGENTHPLYKYLIREKKGFITSGIKWNFTKFLIDRNGKIIKRYAPITSPLKIEEDIKKLLK